MRARLYLAGFCVALALRLWVNFEAHPPAAHVYSDMRAWKSDGLRLLDGRLTNFRPHGYTFLLAPLLAADAQQLSLVALAQAVAGATLCLVAAALAARCARSRALAVAAFIFIAIYPPFLYYGALVLTEIWAALFLTTGVYFLVSAAGGGSRGAVLGASLALAAATLVRSNLILVFLLAFPVLYWAHRQDGGLAMRRTALFLVGALLFVPSIVANSVAAGRPAGLAGNGGLNFFMAHSPYRTVIHGEREITPVPNGLRHTEVLHAPVPLTEESWFYREALRGIAREPGRLVTSLDNVREGLGLGRQAYWPGSSAWQGPLRWSSRAYPWLVVLPVVVHLVVLRRRLFAPWNRAQLIGCLLLAVLVFTLYAFLGDPRMHVPFDAVLIVLALESVRRLWHRGGAILGA